MIYLAFAELAVILILVLLLKRHQDREIDTVMGLLQMQDDRERELLNAARNPGHFLAPSSAPERPEVSPEEQARLQAQREALSRIGRVE